MIFFWNIAPCRLVEFYRRFWGTCCLHRPRLRENLKSHTVNDYLFEKPQYHSSLGVRDQISKSCKASNKSQNSMEYSHPWEVNSSWTYQEISRLLWNHKFHCGVHKSSTGLSSKQHIQSTPQSLCYIKYGNINRFKMYSINVQWQYSISLHLSGSIITFQYIKTFHLLL
jgi:hypothetical protein